MRGVARVYLTRRNLRTLLNKLDRNITTPGESACTLVKQDTSHPTYPCSHITEVVAVEDEEYYSGGRKPGEVFAADDPSQKEGGAE